MPFCEEKKYQNLRKYLFFVLAIDFNMTKILKNPRANTASLSKEESRPTTKVWNILIFFFNVLTSLIWNIISYTASHRQFWLFHS